MKLTARFTLLFVALSVLPVLAQATPFETLTLLRQQYPAVLSPAQLAELLNREAWIYRNDGMKLLGKAGGSNCPLPNGVRISCDYLVHAPTLTGHDVLTDNGTEFIPPTLNAILRGFTWGPGPEPLADAIGKGERTLVDPIEPAGTVTPPVVVPPPVVVVPPPIILPPPVTAPPVDLNAALTEIKALAAEAVKEIKEHRAGVQAVWLKVAAFGGPIVTALLTYLQMRTK